MIALTGLAGMAAATPSFAADKVVLGLDWQALGRHAGFYVAKAKGFYEREGLDVEIQRGYGAADAVKRLAGGDVNFAFGDYGSLILARGEGIKVKAIAMIYARCPYVVWTRKSAAISTPKDLMGKNVGSPAGASVRLLFPAFASKVGFDDSKVKWVTVDAAGLYPLLFTGRADAVVDYELGWPTISGRAKEAGIEIGKLRFRDYGFDLYSNGIMASDQTIATKPDVVRRFVKASLAGMRAAFADPVAAGEIMKKTFPVLDASSAAQEVEIVKSLADPESGNQLGFISQDKASLTRDIVAKAYNLKANVPITDTYTNDFLPKVSP
ncbi:MAG: ABC transporter substrate-binding protein [Proteobacteria bacterium]|nr:ABC transporter substrate-binding protein [Pseudomonadota bacterium]